MRPVNGSLWRINSIKRCRNGCFADISMTYSLIFVKLKPYNFCPDHPTPYKQQSRFIPASARNLFSGTSSGRLFLVSKAKQISLVFTYDIGPDLKGYNQHYHLRFFTVFWIFPFYRAVFSGVGFNILKFVNCPRVSNLIRLITPFTRPMLTIGR